MPSYGAFHSHFEGTDRSLEVPTLIEVGNGLKKRIRLIVIEKGPRQCRIGRWRPAPEPAGRYIGAVGGGAVVPFDVNFAEDVNFPVSKEAMQFLAVGVQTHNGN